MAWETSLKSLVVTPTRLVDGKKCQREFHSCLRKMFLFLFLYTISIIIVVVDVFFSVVADHFVTFAFEFAASGVCVCTPGKISTDWSSMQLLYHYDYCLAGTYDVCVEGMMHEWLYVTFAMHLVRIGNVDGEFRWMDAVVETRGFQNSHKQNAAKCNTKWTHTRK